jgi:hypothetical protein
VIGVRGLVPVLITAALAAGCGASSEPRALDRSVIARVREAGTLHVVHNRPIGLQSAGVTQARLLNNALRNARVGEPTLRVAERLASAAGLAGYARNVVVVRGRSTNPDVAELRQLVSGPWVIDVTTTRFQLEYKGVITAESFRLLYEARARLVDLEHGQIHWLASCKTEGPHVAGQRWLDDPTVYEEEIGRAVDACAAQLARELGRDGSLAERRPGPRG